MKSSVIIAALILMLGACTAQQTATPVTENPSGTPTKATVGLPNPASVSCIKQQGRVDLRPDAAGTVSGICVFPDGRECEEWALFRDHQCVAPREPAPASSAKRL
jgi:putative hemolysin